jgi:pectin methylesterase-like acyl-CoA thioesterase/lysophospholipase L1-like esterase
MRMLKLNRPLPAIFYVSAVLAFIAPAAGQLRDYGRGTQHFRIVLAGDSTVNEGGGWGPGFCSLLAPNIECINLARNGRSSKSYIAEGWWKLVLAQQADFVLIQFGHNDMPGKGPDRETDPGTTYAANIRRYIQEARSAGAQPVVVTSLSRRNYKDGKLVLDLAAYAAAAGRVAREEHVPVIDLNRLSVRLLQSMTQQQADRFNASSHLDAGGGEPDRTHLNAEGSRIFGAMVAAQLAKECKVLRPYIRPESASLPVMTTPSTRWTGLTLKVAADGSAPYRTIQSAIDAAPAGGEALILVAPGTYREVLTIDKPGIQLRGTNPDASRTVVVFNKHAATDGGTGHTATVNVSGDNFLAEDITFQNDYKPIADPLPEGSQAVALRVTGDRAIFRNVRLLGLQDTLYAASRGCTGDGAARSCKPARQYFTDCYIEGHFDFIFGDGKTVFDHCEIHSMPLHEGFITAQSKVYPQQDSGYVIYRSRLTAEPGVAHVWLGRPWRPFSTVTYIETRMGPHIEPAGWREWLPGQTHSLDTSTYSEFGSSGPGATLKQRDRHTIFPTATQAAQYSPDLFLRGDDNWNPVTQEIPDLP